MTSGADESLIVASLERAGERGGDFTPLVYERLFREHPDMKALFVRDTDGSVRGEMLARVIEAILDFAGPCLYAGRLIQCEVVTHEGYDVPRAVFGVFFGVVAGAVRTLNGADWTASTAAAWDRLLADLDRYVTQPDQMAPVG
jgi:hemoglobin-like flavoprotein